MISIGNNKNHYIFAVQIKKKSILKGGANIC